MRTTQEPVGNPQQQQQKMLFERTKIMDTIYVEHKIKVNYLQAAVKHFNIGEDADIKEFETQFK